ncbi:hypothetical protein CBR_g37599 [Chara braunii]|uniref:Reverse transcriptase domain-containing protein n=1 Tax=Chara braunii TaxID=69332 RepID=A0A388LNF2_CHABU|nr:hypothetical protein CBR_g37599 [Chara braunii]|eukprot:GBG83799.1 hypothetical protein CBR_g37599 [Chara braunii]
MAISSSLSSRSNGGSEVNDENGESRRKRRSRSTQHKHRRTTHSASSDGSESESETSGREDDNKARHRRRSRKRSRSSDSEDTNSFSSDSDNGTEEHDKKRRRKGKTKKEKKVKEKRHKHNKDKKRKDKEKSKRGNSSPVQLSKLIRLDAVGAVYSVYCTGAALGKPGQLANETLAEYKQRFQAQIDLIEVEEKRQLAAEAARVQAETAAAAEKLRLQAEADAATQARRKEAQNLLQRHEATSIERLKFWHFEPNGDGATPKEQHKEFMAKLVARLVYTCNHLQTELANLQRAVRNHKAQHEDATWALDARVQDLEQVPPRSEVGKSSIAPSAHQLEERVDHAVAMLGDIIAFAAPATISQRFDLLDTKISQQQQTDHSNNNNSAKPYKMPTFRIEKFDDYTHQDPVVWWQGFTTELGIHEVPNHLFIRALFINTKGGCQMSAGHEKSTWQPSYVEKVRTGPRQQHFAAVQQDSGDNPAATPASSDGDQVAAVQPRSTNKSRNNGKAKSASQAGNGQPGQFPWVKFGLTYWPAWSSTGSAHPPRDHPRGRGRTSARLHLPNERGRVLRAQVGDVLEKGLIRSTSSPYGAPVVFVRKKNKDLRLCIDYRKLNAMIRNAGPLPRIDVLLERLRDSKFFSKLDLKLGYHQLEIRKEDRYKTTFKTWYGHFEWLVMPFGLTNTPATFEAAMTTEFRHMLDRFVLIYLDDILVYSRSLDKHVEHLRTVLERLRQAKYKANRDKCEFAQQELEYLGHYVTPKDIRPLADKIEAL